MSLTLRQLQKMFSAAARSGRNHKPGQTKASELGSLARFVSDVDRHKFMEVTPDGSLFNQCSCHACVSVGRAVGGIRSKVDSWVREYGPETTIDELIEAEFAKRSPQPPQTQPQPGQDQQGQQGQQGQGQQGQSQQGQQGQQGQGQGQPQQNSQMQPTGSASGQGQPQEDPMPTPQPAPKPTPAPQPDPRQQAFKAAQKALKDAMDAAEKAQTAAGKKSAEELVRRAKQALRKARKLASFDKKAMAAGVSLQARKQVARGLGRLQRVSQKLRNQTAGLINRLVEQGGSVGETTGPIPVLSASKLVRRMVVRRPLPNALKEDTIAGRPVVLFLPDISPSCAEQAQVACDLANAAGYAGVAGSDVLVLPHFNGGVDSTEEYIPWFNGKPVATDPREVARLFEDICSGKSKFRVRVAVFLGDHDAVDRYGDIADLRSVTRVLWLHNSSTRSRQPEPAADRLLPNWSPEAMGKLSMMAGCVDQPRMLTGFDTALKMR